METFNDNENEYILEMPELNYAAQGGLGEEFFRCMRKNSKKTAQIISSTGEKDSYGSLLKRCVRTALNMRLKGLNQDDIVSICSNNHLNSCVPFLSSIFLGIKVASLDPTLSVADTVNLLKQVKPRIIFLVPEAIELIRISLEQAGVDTKLVIFGYSDDFEQFDEYLNEVEGEEDFEPVHLDLQETSIIFFSSGTTGMPKGICQSGYAILNQGFNVLTIVVSMEVSLGYPSLYWNTAVVMLTASLLSGQTRVICSKFDPIELWQIIEKYKINVIFLAPTLAMGMLKAVRPDSLDTSSLLTIIIGGGSFPETSMCQLRDLLPATFISQAYGQTEIVGIITVFNQNDVKEATLLHHKTTSCGKLINGLCAKVVDIESGKTLGPNQPGELRLKTKYAMKGYHNLDSSEAFDSDGWLRTGDIVYYDRDHCFYVVDRIKEMLKYKSWHVAPAMLENILQTHPDVQRATVIGIPHDEDGDHPMGLVILHPDSNGNVSADDLAEFLNSQVSERQKLRAGIKFVERLEVTPSGKVKKQEMLRKVLAGEI